MPPQNGEQCDLCDKSCCAVEDHIMERARPGHQKTLMPFVEHRYKRGA